MTARFAVLGEIEIRFDGMPIAAGHARQRSVLAALLFDANRVVSADTLVDRVWGEQPPHRARGTLSSYLTRLRQALPADVSITRHSGGYLLTVDPAAVDLHRARTLLRDARAAGTDDLAEPLLREALGLWRGEPFAGLDTPWVNGVRDTLEKERLAAELDLTDIRMRRGEHAALLPELSARAAERPLDERIAGQYLLALYRCDRQADALDCYERLRRRLASELGADPCQALRTLHQRMLRADPALAPAARRLPMPRQLPAPPHSFIGRTRELAALGELLDVSGALPIAAIDGAGGTGKTWLAVHWAHRHLDRFPDGQLYVNLRGFDPSGAAVPPSAAIRAFLDALGVDPSAIPSGVDAQAALYRSVLADKRMLVLLDNARDAAQVLPLLPGGSRCTVVTTSRNQLTGLVTTHGARDLTLGVLTDAESRELLTRQLGAARVDAEPVAVNAFVRYCAGLPLALSIVAARAGRHPGFPLASLAEELEDGATRLDALGSGDLNADIRAVFSWSWHALGADALAVFPLLGAFPGSDITPFAVASLAGLPLSRVRGLLRELEAANLVQQHAPGRYRMHDLLRLYGSEQAPADEAQAALRRVTEFYLHTAHAADRLLDPHRPSIELGPLPPGREPQALPDRAAALSWFGTEYANLGAVHRLAVESGWDETVWLLSRKMEAYRWLRGHADDSLVACRDAVAATRRLGDRRAEGWALVMLGHALTRSGHFDEAVATLRESLSVLETTGDKLGAANAHMAVGDTLGLRDEHLQALRHTRRAVRLFRELGDVVWGAVALTMAAKCCARLGRPDAARACSEYALPLLRKYDNQESEGAALLVLGDVAPTTGEAIGYYERALAVLSGLGYTFYLPDIHVKLGETHAAAGDTERARVAWQDALDLYAAQYRTADVRRMRDRLQGS
ncbi:BTAD domain-containing putative transcriptional regulator [Amycolatopsis sp. NPDC059657]|uniref:AfsR/SARP family transcriptional regulator n=1 Tax=Amycolatopsis sp. NPDC059657 TaxID=3346899 RepID=UPI0036703BEE